MDYIAQIYSLSSEFYAAYPNTCYPEIVVKKDRPYSCLLIEYMDDIFICVPFRSHVRHNYAYLFKNSERSRRCRSGLDYTKIVLIKNSAYLSDEKAVVDSDEYKETIRNLPKIVDEVYKYILDYKNDLNGVRKLHPKEWQRRYGMSTLPYFEGFLKEPVTKASDFAE